MRILVTSDIHIGRRPSGVPAEKARRYSAAETWREIVRCAAERHVDAVLLAGDTVDESNKYFEAVSALEDGLKTLADANIKTIAVAGNHDTDVLPRLAAEPELAMTVLGAEGDWEFTEVEDPGGNAVQIFGWSFNNSYVYNSPVPNFPKNDLKLDMPAIGLIHADLDNVNSPYCPVTSGELRTVPVDLWVTGHIHKPDFKDADTGNIIVNAGSPQGLDPGIGERGLHGPWLLENTAGKWNCEHIPLAGFVYSECKIDISGVETGEELQQLFISEIRRKIKDLRENGASLEVFCSRINVTGGTFFTEKSIADVCKEICEQCLEGLFLENVQVLISGWQDNSTPGVDLEELKKEESLLGEVALLMLELQGEEELRPGTEELIRKAEDDVASINESRIFAGLSTDSESSYSEENDRESLCRNLRTGAGKLLNKLLQQQNQNSE